MEKAKRGPYALFFKRLIDIVASLMVLILFCWLYVILAILVRIKLGSPILFKQERPGKIDPRTGKETIFCLYKFRTMTDARDENGEWLPDSERLTPFGSWLRRTSMDERVIIGQTTESLENKGFREVSPISFLGSCSSFSRYGDGDEFGDIVTLSA